MALAALKSLSLSGTLSLSPSLEQVAQFRKSLIEWITLEHISYRQIQAKAVKFLSNRAPLLQRAFSQNLVILFEDGSLMSLYDNKDCFEIKYCHRPKAKFTLPLMVRLLPIT